VKLFLLQSPPDVEANNVEPGVGGNVGEMNQDGHNSASDSRSGCANQLESAKNQVSSSSGDNVAHDNHTYCVIDGQDNFYFVTQNAHKLIPTVDVSNFRNEGVDGECGD
jgi:hypothetical protein